MLYLDLPIPCLHSAPPASDMQGACARTVCLHGLQACSFDRLLPFNAFIIKHDSTLMSITFKLWLGRVLKVVDVSTDHLPVDDEVALLVYHVRDHEHLQASIAYIRLPFAALSIISYENNGVCVTPHAVTPLK